MVKPTPFKIAAPEQQLSWITDRVKTTRLPPGKELPVDRQWSFGLPIEVATHLKNYWTDEFDWRKVEAQLNSEMDMFTLPISQNDEDLTIHFVHHASPSHDALPLLFIHGWPGNFTEVRYIIDELTKPSSPDAQAYHVVAPSLPGYGFSSYPKKPFGIIEIAATLNKLMLALGYDQYMAQGGDWGSLIARVMALEYEKQCIGIHLNMIISVPPSALWAPVAFGRLMFGYLTGRWSEYEAKSFKRMKWWMDEENGYRAIQGTKPQTISYALTDSPFGMMCWIRDKMQHLVDDDFVWKDEEVITWAMIYILNGTPGHAEIYKTTMGEGETEMRACLTRLISVPMGVSVFPKDPMYAQRWWAEAAVGTKVVFWKEHDEGGHFASVEKPVQLIEDIRSFTAAAKLVVTK